MPHCLQPHHKHESVPLMTPRVHPRLVTATATKPSRLIQAGAITLIVQFLALIFFAGQFFERQQNVDESMKIMKIQQTQILSDLAVIKAWQTEYDRRISLLEEIERQEGHERARGK